MKIRTRDKLLEQAEVLFSQKGFYGTSINDVAAEVDVSKQALLHHFSSKEKLYAAVLQNAADHLLQFVQAHKDPALLPNVQFGNIFKAMSSPDEKSYRVIMLLMRELLDNRERAEDAHQWFLRPFLDELTGIVETGQKQGQFNKLPAFAFVYQLLGAAQYYLVSLPTLKQLYSEQECEEHRRQHLALLGKWID